MTCSRGFTPNPTKRRALGTHPFKFRIAKAPPLVGVPGTQSWATPPGGFQGGALSGSPAAKVGFRAASAYWPFSDWKLLRRHSVAYRQRVVMFSGHGDDRACPRHGAWGNEAQVNQEA